MSVNVLSQMRVRLTNTTFFDNEVPINDYLKKANSVRLFPESDYEKFYV